MQRFFPFNIQLLILFELLGDRKSSGEPWDGGFLWIGVSTCSQNGAGVQIEWASTNQEGSDDRTGGINESFKSSGNYEQSGNKVQQQNHT